MGNSQALSRLFIWVSVAQASPGGCQGNEEGLSGSALLRLQGLNLASREPCLGGLPQDLQLWQETDL